MMLPTHFVAAFAASVAVVFLLRSVDCESECFRNYSQRWAKCGRKISGLSSTISYKECCSKPFAKAWASDAVGGTCIRCVSIVDGGWGVWGKWGNCSVACGDGITKRMRVCDSPVPMHGGEQCRGPESEKRPCHTKVGCKVDGHWTAWTSWSACSHSCKEGFRTRSRSCSNPKPQFGGKDCYGENKTLAEICVENANCPSSPYSSGSGENVQSGFGSGSGTGTVASGEGDFITPAVNIPDDTEHSSGCADHSEPSPLSGDDSGPSLESGDDTEPSPASGDDSEPFHESEDDINPFHRPLWG